MEMKVTFFCLFFIFFLAFEKSILSSEIVVLH